MLKSGTVLIWLIWLLLGLAGLVHAGNLKPIQIKATVTDNEIILTPDTIPSNTPFIIHIDKQTNNAVELENSDTSAEIYTAVDKTFKVGLSQGSYIFFNDFATHTKKAILSIKDNYIMPTLSTTLTNTNSRADNPVKKANSPVFSEIIFIVWRESIEALLVVSIAFSWIKQLAQNRARAMLYLFLGIILGLTIAAIFGSILIKVNTLISTIAQNYLQAIMAIVAAVMIVYMVKWMRKNGRTLKTEMHNSMTKANNRWNIAILTVVAVAIAREGSEAMIFIYAMGFGAHGVVSTTMLLALATGVILAIVTMYLLSLGNKIFSWKYFFKITEVLLLLLGGGMLLNGLNLLSTTGIFPQALLSHLWQGTTNTNFGDKITPLLSSLFGYKASPTILDLLAYIAYWLIIIKLLDMRIIKKR